MVIKKFALIVLFSLVLVACASAEPEEVVIPEPEAPSAEPSAVPTEAPTASPEPTMEALPFVDSLWPDGDAEVLEEFTVVFTGEACLYDGPQYIVAGEMIMARDNQSEARMVADIGVLIDHNYDELLDFLGEPSDQILPPTWYPKVSASPIVSNPLTSRVNLEHGSYGISCVITNDNGSLSVFMASPLWVE